MTGIFRKGQRELVRGSVASAIVIARNDMLFLADSTDDVDVISNRDWTTDLATTQAAIADVFLGIAYELSASGDTDNISVDISAVSVYEFTVTSAVYTLGQPLGPAQNGALNKVLAQTLVGAVASSAVARAAEESPAATTLLDVKFASVYNTAANTAAGEIG